jgi:hypothetical protein
MIRRLLLGSAVAVLAACSGNDPGYGTQTLYVSARLSTDGSTDGTSARVEVRSGSSTGAIVSDAEVKLRGPKLDSRTLAFSTQGNGGAYVLNNFTWDTNFILEVKRGSDNLGASIDPPGASVITAPIAGTTFRLADGKPLAVEWKDELGRRAKSVTLRLEKAKQEETWADSGEPMRFEFATSRLVKDDKERVELDRTNELTLAGGAAGSTMRATSSHRIEFTVE